MKNEISSVIETVEITNFQSHKHTILEFHPGVNIFKGTSHHGKSSAIRALRWALFNKAPGKGDGFKSSFANKKEPVEVAVAFSDGDWFSRVKTHKENQYLSDGLELNVVRKGVPDEIQSITKIKDINFQNQNDDYFLIEGSPGKAGSRLNEIIGLQIIDESRTKSNKKVSETDNDLKKTEEDLKNTKEKLKKYKHVKYAERLINRIEVLSKQLEGHENKYQKIIRIISSAKTFQNTIDNLKEKIEVEIDINEVKKLYASLREKEDRKHLIDSIILHIKTYSHDRKQILDRLEIQSDEIKDIDEKFLRLKELEEQVSNIDTLLDAIFLQERKKEELTERIKLDEPRKKELKKQLNFCPTCGSEKKYWKEKDIIRR